MQAVITHLLEKRILQKGDFEWNIKIARFSKTQEKTRHFRCGPAGPVPPQSSIHPSDDGRRTVPVTAGVTGSGISSLAQSLVPVSLGEKNIPPTSPLPYGTHRRKPLSRWNPSPTTLSVFTHAEIFTRLPCVTINSGDEMARLLADDDRQRLLPCPHRGHGGPHGCPSRAVTGPTSAARPTHRRWEAASA